MEPLLRRARAGRRHDPAEAGGDDPHRLAACGHGPGEPVPRRPGAATAFRVEGGKLLLLDEGGRVRVRLAPQGPGRGERAPAPGEPAASPPPLAAHASTVTTDPASSWLGSNPATRQARRSTRSWSSSPTAWASSARMALSA